MAQQQHLRTTIAMTRGGHPHDPRTIDTKKKNDATLRKTPAGRGLVTSPTADPRTIDMKKKNNDATLRKTSAGGGLVTGPTVAHDSLLTTTTMTTTTTTMNKNDVACCYHSPVNWAERYTPTFFQRNPEFPKELENISEHIFTDSNMPLCELEWHKFLLGHLVPLHPRAKLYLMALSGNPRHPNAGAPHRTQRYVRDDPALPRILFLGDSISRGISGFEGHLAPPPTTTEEDTWISQFDFFRSAANIHVTPNNCEAFDNYRKQLTSVWLGDCPWDVIQFNVGAHFAKFNEQHKFLDEQDMDRQYEEGLTWIIQELRKHSPQASIVFATTTPSPLDSDDTSRLAASSDVCPNSHKFHKAGMFSHLNDIAKRVCQKHNVIVNDRHQIILPLLGQYQNPCDIHFSPEGYEFLAKHDFDFISNVLLHH